MGLVINLVLRIVLAVISAATQMALIIAPLLCRLLIWAVPRVLRCVRGLAALLLQVLAGSIGAARSRAAAHGQLPSHGQARRPSTAKGTLPHRLSADRTPTLRKPPKSYW